MVVIGVPGRAQGWTAHAREGQFCDLASAGQKEWD